MLLASAVNQNHPPSNFSNSPMTFLAVLFGLSMSTNRLAQHYPMKLHGSACSWHLFECGSKKTLRLPACTGWAPPRRHAGGLLRLCSTASASPTLGPQVLEPLLPCPTGPPQSPGPRARCALVPRRAKWNHRLKLWERWKQPCMFPGMIWARRFSPLGSASEACGNRLGMQFARIWKIDACATQRRLPHTTIRTMYVIKGFALPVHTHTHTHLFSYLSASLSGYLPINPYFYLSIDRSIYLSLYLSIYLPFFP